MLVGVEVLLREDRTLEALDWTEDNFDETEEEEAVKQQSQHVRYEKGNKATYSCRGQPRWPQLAGLPRAYNWPGDTRELSPGTSC